MKHQSDFLKKVERQFDSDSMGSFAVFLYRSCACKALWVKGFGVAVETSIPTLRVEDKVIYNSTRYTVGYICREVNGVTFVHFKELLQIRRRLS